MLSPSSLPALTLGNPSVARRDAAVADPCKVFGTLSASVVAGAAAVPVGFTDAETELQILIDGERMSCGSTGLFPTFHFTFQSCLHSTLHSSVF